MERYKGSWLVQNALKKYCIVNAHEQDWVHWVGGSDPLTTIKFFQFLRPQNIRCNRHTPAVSPHCWVHSPTTQNMQRQIKDLEAVWNKTRTDFFCCPTIIQFTSKEFGTSALVMKHLDINGGECGILESRLSVFSLDVSHIRGLRR